jgi:D-amino-acid dehydrogenase
VLAGPFAAALFAPEYWVVSSPSAVLAALRRRLRQVVPERVIEIRADAGEVALLTDKGADLPFDQVVVAGGVWSRDLVRGLGLKVLLECERGYNTTFPVHALELPMPVFFAEHGFVVSPLAEGIRVGGAVELAAPDAPPNFARAAAMRTKARRYMPGLPESGGAEWMGRRPSTPDSLPVIGRHPRDPRIVFAFGHGHLGLTLSAVTARHVAALLRGTEEAGLARFSIARFQ